MDVKSATRSSGSDQRGIDKVDDATTKVDDSDHREDSTQNTILCDGPSSGEDKRVFRKFCSSYNLWVQQILK